MPYCIKGKSRFDCAKHAFLCVMVRFVDRKKPRRLDVTVQIWYVLYCLKTCLSKTGNVYFLFDLGNYNVNVIGNIFFICWLKKNQEDKLTGKQTKLEKCHIKSYSLGHKDSIFFRKKWVELEFGNLRCLDFFKAAFSLPWYWSSSALAITLPPLIKLMCGRKN